MMQIDGTITTAHQNPVCVASAIRIDNLAAMETSAAATTVATTITGTKLRSVIASVDDYLMNLAIADEACRYSDTEPADNGRMRTVRNSGKERNKVR